MVHRLHERSVPHLRIPDEKQVESIYQFGRTLGKGSFAFVYEATEKNQKNKKWGIKTVCREKAGNVGMKMVEREIAILKMIQHPNIIHLEKVYETPQKVYLVLELCERGLNELYRNRLENEETFTETEVRKIVTSLASAIWYLHKYGIVHRDVKLENILVGQNPKDPNDKLFIKLTDFGLSVLKGTGHDSMFHTFCGTLIYMAPEILSNKLYSSQCDVWAIGVIMYMLLSGSAPYDAPDEGMLQTLICNADLQFLKPVWNNISSSGRDLLGRILQKDPAHRLTAGEILDQAWITGQNVAAGRPANILELMHKWQSDSHNSST